MFNIIYSCMYAARRLKQTNENRSHFTSQSLKKYTLSNTIEWFERATTINIDVFYECYRKYNYSVFNISKQKFRINTNDPRNKKFCKSTRPLRAIFSHRLFGLDSQQLMTSSRIVYQRIQFLCKRNWIGNNTKGGSRKGLALV